MPRLERSDRGAAITVVLVLVSVALLLSPVVLHFSQKRHNVLPFDVDVAYPADMTLVGGEAYGSTVAELMAHELGGWTGWRPNDFFLWGPAVMADNNAHRQLGIILAIRESVRVFRDHLTKISATEFDANLVEADTAFRNDSEKFWLPSAEGKFASGVERMRRYVDGLAATPPTSNPINGRNVELVRLFQAWTEVLGDAHAMLFKDTEADGSAIPPWKTDDYFYRVQGTTHVLYHLCRAIRRDYAATLEDRSSLLELLDEATAALGRAALLKPVIVLDGGPDGIFANHRRNLDGFVVEARQKMYSIREELTN